VIGASDVWIAARVEVDDDGAEAKLDPDLIKIYHIDAAQERRDFCEHRRFCATDSSSKAMVDHNADAARERVVGRARGEPAVGRAVGQGAECAQLPVSHIPTGARLEAARDARQH